MRLADTLRYTHGALRGHGVRTLLLLLAMAIGVAAVVLLTGLGEAARRYVISEFSSLGSELLIVLPGRSETTGGPPPLLGQTPRDLTIDDAMTLERSPLVRRIAPISVGSAPISRGNRERDAMVVGTTAPFLEIRHLKLAQGRFLPLVDPHQAAPLCVIGSKIRAELFGPRTALGEWVRMGERRCRVIGILAAKGRGLDLDTDELVIIPVAFAQSLFDNPALFRVLVEASHRDAIDPAKREILRLIQARHDGEDDITVITQDSLLSTFDRILRTLTYAVAGIAAISLLVAGVLIMNVMLVAVSQRATEIGLLKALGASRHDIILLFIAEAGLLSLLGGATGYGLGSAGSLVLGRFYPHLNFTAPPWAVAAALLVALGSGLLFSILPARRAAHLDPIAALARR